MTAKEWRAKGRAASEEEAVELTLPSGMVIRARRPGAMQFAAWEQLPLMLLNAVAPGRTASSEETMDVARMLKELLVYCCLAPRIVEEAEGEDEITPREVPEGDWEFIVAWAMRMKEAAAVRPFRAGGADDGGGKHGQVIQMPAERADGDRGPGDGAGVRPGGGA